MDNICLKVLVDKENNRVICAQSDEDFVDVLLSFLTIPMAAVIKLISDDQPPKIGIGSLNNLFESVGNLDPTRFRSVAGKPMLLYPQNAASRYCKNLKLKAGGVKPSSFFLCSNINNNICKYKLLSHYDEVYCCCGNRMSHQVQLIESQNVCSNAQNRGVFVKAFTCLLVTDELQIIPPSTAASISLISKFGVTDVRKLEERTINVGANEVLKLLKCSFVSKTPLTDTLLKQAVPEIQKGNFGQVSAIKQACEARTSNGNGNISIKLIFSKSKKKVCFAEVSEDFVDLLFSFLTIPLGFILKEMHGGHSNGCFNHLYNSIKDSNFEKNFNSNEHKQMLLSPKIAPGFGYEGQLLDVEEAANEQYYYAYSQEWTKGRAVQIRELTNDPTPFQFGSFVKTELTVMGPKSPIKEAASGEGFVRGPAMFIVTDDLIITPISPISGLSVLNKLQVPFSDIEERVVHLGKENASRLLVASFISESVLTDIFIGNESKRKRED